MTIFQRLVLMLKVLVLLSLGMSSAWASNPVQSGAAGFSATHNDQLKGLQLAEEKDDKEDDDSTSEEPDTDSDGTDPDDDDSQT